MISTIILVIVRNFSKSYFKVKSFLKLNAFDLSLVLFFINKSICRTHLRPSFRVRQPQTDCLKKSFQYFDFTISCNIKDQNSDCLKYLYKIMFSSFVYLLQIHPVCSQV